MGCRRTGTLFGTAYVAVLNQAIETYDSHLGLLQYAADGLVSVAARLIQSDEGAAQRVNQAGGASPWG